MKNRTANLLAIMAFSLASSCLSTQALTWDLALDFSTNSNPNGVWAYGYTTTLGGSLNLYDESGDASGLLFWRHNLALGAPSVVWNSTTNPIQGGTPVIAPGAAAFHPGPNGQYSLFRFTAPADDSYRLESSFFGSDMYGTSTDVHVLLNSEAIFNGSVNGYGPTTGPAFNTNLVLRAGDQVDFAVGFGNGSFFYDTTGISARLVSETPNLSIAFTAPETVVITWPSPSTNWQLQQNTNSLSSASWNDVTDAIQDDGTTKTLIVNPTTGDRFYRLHKQ
jgi:hypothetical protein